MDKKSIEEYIENWMNFIKCGCRHSFYLHTHFLDGMKETAEKEKTAMPEVCAKNGALSDEKSYDFEIKVDGLVFDMINKFSASTNFLFESTLTKMFFGEIKGGGQIGHLNDDKKRYIAFFALNIFYRHLPDKTKEEKKFKKERIENLIKALEDEEKKSKQGTKENGFEFLKTLKDWQLLKLKENYTYEEKIKRYEEIIKEAEKLVKDTNTDEYSKHPGRQHLLATLLFEKAKLVENDTEKLEERRDALKKAEEAVSASISNNIYKFAKAYTTKAEILEEQAKLFTNEANLEETGSENKKEKLLEARKKLSEAIKMADEAISLENPTNHARISAHYKVRNRIYSTQLAFSEEEALEKIKETKEDFNKKLNQFLPIGGMIIGLISILVTTANLIGNSMHPLYAIIIVFGLFGALLLAIFCISVAMNNRKLRSRGVRHGGKKKYLRLKSWEKALLALGLIFVVLALSGAIVMVWHPQWLINNNV